MTTNRTINTTAAPAGPTTGGIIGALVFWGIAIVLALITVPLSNQPSWVWVLRILVTLGGVGLAVGLILREKARAGQGLPPDRDATAFDLWTIAHTMAGVVMGAWGVPGPLVVLYTVAWEVFEWQVPGFGDTEIFSNRVVDIAVAWVGWIVFAGIVALITGIAMPWILPSIQSLLRDGGLHLF